MGSQFERRDLTALRPKTADDEIDLGELIRNIVAQWKLIGLITALGAILGVGIALWLPKQYRVEAVIPQPKSAQIEALLAQPHVGVSSDGVMRELLINLNTFANAEQAYARSFADAVPEQTPAERTSAIQSISRNLAITPQQYGFLGDEAPLMFSYVSVSLLSAEPELAKTYIDELITLAADQTLDDLVSRVQSAIRVEMERAEREYNLVYREAEETLTAEKSRLAQGLAIAEQLALTEPTSWNALIYGSTNVQMLNPEALARDTLFLKGTRFLQSQLAALNTEEAILGFLPARANELQARIKTLQNDMIDEAELQIVPADVQARVPASAEKPNRPLIAVAATVLSGFLGLFIALIASAVRRKDDRHPI